MSDFFCVMQESSITLQKIRLNYLIQLKTFFVSNFGIINLEEIGKEAMAFGIVGLLVIAAFFVAVIIIGVMVGIAINNKNKQ